MIFGKVFTVSEVNLSLKELIHKDPTFANLQIQGEVSNFRRYASGHCYFNLKDSKGLIKCVMFKGAAQRLKKLPRMGTRLWVSAVLMSMSGMGSINFMLICLCL